METKRFCEYVSRRKISEGAFGQIYSVYKTMAGHDVALKYLPKDYETLQKGIEYPLELDIMRRLDHPNLMHAEEILSVIDPNCQELNGLAIIMPKAQATLGQVIPLEELAMEDRIYIMSELLKGLAFLHSQNILHLDIKPGNIVLIGDDAKFIDFGLSLKVDKASVGEYTAHDRITLNYRPPENLIPPNKVFSEKSDIWSLGIVFLELLSHQAHLTVLTTEYTNQTVYTKYKELFDPEVINTTLQRLLPNNEAGQSLIKGMLGWNPDERPTAQQCLSHPIFLTNPPQVLLQEGKVIVPTTPTLVAWDETKTKMVSAMLTYAQTQTPKMLARTLFLAVDLLYRYLVDPDTSTYWDLLPGTCLLLASYYFYDTEGVVNIPLYLRQAHLELMFSEDNMYMTELLILKRFDYILYRPWLYDAAQTGDQLRLAVPLLTAGSDYYQVNPQAFMSVELLGQTSKRISLQALFMAPLKPLTPPRTILPNPTVDRGLFNSPRFRAYEMRKRRN
jgi:serine/threonine protein kinase